MKKTTTMILALFVTIFAYLLVPETAKADNNKRVDILTTTLGYDIIKQGEKLSNDPYDIKETDLRKFAYVCTNSSFIRKLKHNSKEFSDEVNGVCKIITSVNKNKNE
ncbi:hypothetical protein VPDG_00112 [Vibrio phage henriette 12B8]|uniref:hypothetical protein n=1 Tax=Vibrio phage henriette 12B8 TaxID=573174 RepID=UPI0002C0FC15|nr:hypothetical protein VPDG_00112 [Vibrio phage henriette 12B8]AGG58273.1 hypothetical protein VPDG_00112 [Vibrio phage henriette 12B8]